MNSPTCVVVLAAGEGTRMRSARPKPLHELCGKAMVLYVLDAALQENVRATVVVVGRDATWVQKVVGERIPGDDRRTFVEQAEQLGTGHAVTMALASVDDALGESEGDVLILPSDTPLLRHATVARLLSEHRESNAALTVLSTRMDDPTGYGRLIHAKDGTLERIVEERDANLQERRVHEVNTSIMVVRHSVLGPALRRVGRHNAQHEYYLTDLVAVLHEMGHVTRTLELDDPSEALGVNDRRQLALAEATLRQRLNDEWMLRGVSMVDPLTTYLDADVELAPDVELLPGTILRGHCVIARGAVVGPYACLSDVRVGENAYVGTVEASRVHVGADARVASFVSLAPGTQVAPGARVTAVVTGSA